MDLSLPDNRYREPESQARFFREVMERTRSIPGVTAVGVTENLPLHSVMISNFHIAGRPEAPIGSLPMADHARVSPRYFETLGLRMVAGRSFTDADLAMNEKDGDGVAIVNQAFARQFLPGEDPLAKRLLSTDKSRAHQIVGVVSDYRPMGVENGTRPQIFWPYLKLRSATLVVRTASAPESFTKAIQSAMRSVDKDIPADKFETLDSYLNEWQAQRKFNTLLLAFFAGLALVLAMTGIYGVLSNLVASRKREIAIRMAIGGRTSQIAALVLRQSLTPVVIGLAAGVAGSLALSRFLESLLFQVHPRDPLTLSASVLVILLLSPAAIAVPLSRAIRVDCTVALRDE